MRLPAVALALALGLPPAMVAQSPESIQETMRQAVELARTGQVDEAVSLLERQSTATGLHLPGMSLLGALYLEQGDNQKAFDILSQVADREDAGMLALVSAGRAAFNLGRVDEAEGWMTRAVEILPASDVARDFGLYLGNRQRFEEAARVLLPYLEANPADAAAALGLAMAALKSNRLDAAEEAIARLPATSPATVVLKATVAFQKGEPMTARSLLEPLWASHPPELDLDLRRLLGEIYIVTGDAAKAVTLLTGIADPDPSTALLLGTALYQTGDAPASEQALAKHLGGLDAPRDELSAEQLSNAVAIATEYARAVVAQGRAAEVVPLLEEATRALPEAAEAWNVLGHALIAVGRGSEAREAIGRYHLLAGGAPLASDGS